jgi:trigger factor
LLSEIGRVANIQVSQAELTAALRQEASRYPGQEMQVVEFYRKTPQAIEQLRGPIFEDKVVDYILEVAKVEDRIVSPEELSLPPADDVTRPKVTFTPEAESETEAAGEGVAETEAHAESEPEAAEAASGDHPVDAG